MAFINEEQFSLVVYKARDHWLDVTNEYVMEHRAAGLLHTMHWPYASTVGFAVTFIIALTTGIAVNTTVVCFIGVLVKWNVIDRVPVTG